LTIRRLRNRLDWALMYKDKALNTHVWISGRSPREIKQEGKAIQHIHCSICGRDFVLGFEGTNSWQAAYIGTFRTELLSERAGKRWLGEECPGRLLPDDDVARLTRRS
jgi:hypothetical protein